MEHKFIGDWITDSEFSELKPREVFHRQLEPIDLPCDEHRNRHILFRREFNCKNGGQNARIYITADDYYKLYINGRFVAQGPTPSYHFAYNYNVIDVGEYLIEGKNVIAVHTLYQGLINRVWQSGDNRHGLILDLLIDGDVVLSSDCEFKTAPHTAYTETGMCGYQTQFLERYDSNAPEVGFEMPDYDDSEWKYAEILKNNDHVLRPQTSKMLCFEKIEPVKMISRGNRVFCDFGSNYVAYLNVTAKGMAGDVITVRCAQELNADGSVRYDLRANCRYEEEWILADGESSLDWFDYKSFRYAEFIVPDGVNISDIYVTARHYPFELKAKMKADFADSEIAKNIWNLCVNTQKYGVQEVIQDCMEREKGFYLGDGCYTALTHMILTGDDSMVRRLIDDAFATEFVTDTLVTCMNCSFMQEIAEYPLILVYLVLWHYNFTGDREYLSINYPKVTKLLEAYKRDYEKGNLLRELDKWCVVEWPGNFRHGYDVDIREGHVCHPAHVSLNSYYIEAIRTANRIANALGLPEYRREKPLLDAFNETLFVPEKKLYRDGENTDHISLVGNSFVFGFDLSDDEEFKANVISMIEEHGIDSLSLFCTFPILMGLIKNNRYDLVKKAVLNDGAWRRMLREDATTTFEGWGRETKWNTSLFHLTMSYAAVFMADVDLHKIFG